MISSLVVLPEVFVFVFMSWFLFVFFVALWWHFYVPVLLCLHCLSLNQVLVSFIKYRHFGLEGQAGNTFTPK